MQQQQTVQSSEKSFNTYLVTIYHANLEGVEVELYAKNPHELKRFLNRFDYKDYTFVEV